MNAAALIFSSKVIPDGSTSSIFMFVTLVSRAFAFNPGTEISSTFLKKRSLSFLNSLEALPSADPRPNLSIVLFVSLLGSLRLSLLFADASLWLEKLSLPMPPLCAIMSCGLPWKNALGFLISLTLNADSVNNVLYDANLCNTFGSGVSGSSFMLRFLA